jgi:zinc protease
VSASPRPTPSTARPYNFPEIERHRLSNGVRILVAQMPRLPLVTVLALVDAGATCDPKGAEGTASLTARTLTEGTASLDGAALTDRLEALGTSLDGYADWDSTAARFTVMPSRLAEAFTLFTDVLRAPAFPTTDVARRRDERLADLTQRLSEPRGLADQRFAGFLYAPGSRYARSAGGTLDTVATLDADAVRDFHGTRYSPAVTTLIFVGAVTPREAVRLSESALGDWHAPVAIGGAGPASERSVERRTVIVDKPDAPQTELRIGHIGVPRSHPDHLRIVVMNALLGGLFSSRINLNLRERHAFTYGASSGFEWRRDAGPFVVSTAVKSEVTARAVEEILREIDGMRAAAPDANELALATDYLGGVFPLRYESTDAVAGAIANAAIFDLPHDWFLSYRRRVRAITAEEVLAAARVHLDPSRLLVLALGDPSVIGAPLEALAHGPMRVVAATHDPAEEE